MTLPPTLLSIELLKLSFNVTPSFTQTDECIIVINDDGMHYIKKLFSAGIGVGYIHRVVRPDGIVLVDDPANGVEILNDPCYGGLFGFGFHAARDNGEPDVWNRTWDVTCRQCAPNNAGFGTGDLRVISLDTALVNGGAAVILVCEVDFFDHECLPGEPLLTVRYNYTFFASRVNLITEVITKKGAHSGSPAFIKEPKFVAHSLGAIGQNNPKYRYVDIFRADGSLLEKYDIWKLPNPTFDTKQIGYDTRARLRFSDPTRGNHYLNVVARSLYSGVRKDWENQLGGLDEWAVKSNSRQVFEPHGDTYCLQGPGNTLTRQWEVTRWARYGRNTEPDISKPQTGVMFHAWEGGFGYSDCRRCYRRYGPHNEKWTNFFSFSYDSGWIV